MIVVCRDKTKEKNIFSYALPRIMSLQHVLKSALQRSNKTLSGLCVCAWLISRKFLVITDQTTDLNMNQVEKMHQDILNDA